MFVTGRREGMSLRCDEVNYSTSANALRMAAACWWYYISKLFEFVDSFSMVLRKRDKQLSFLHLYHHSTMFPLWWIGVSYVAGGNTIIGATMNCIVHVRHFFHLSRRLIWVAMPTLRHTWRFREGAVPTGMFGGG